MPTLLRILPLLVALAAVLPRSIADKSLYGFTGAGAAAQFELESSFDALLDADNLEAWMRRMSSKPHHVGSPHGKANAEFVASLFRDWGYETEIVEYQVLFPTPKIRELELVAPTSYRAQLEEPAVEGDASSSITEGVLPPYNAYSGDGDVTAEVVYVNYGIPADYEELERRGIDVAGKIVLARYGGSWRGIKPKVAAEHGAIGCILYSDPINDGYVQGDVYPEGAYRNEWGAQRGSVADMPLYAGDPLTPFVGATADAERLALEDSPTLMKIPVLPISYADALPILAAIGGPVAPSSWRGGLPETYHIGPGPARVHLRLEFNWDLAPAYNVIARLRGSTLPDEWIIRGNHRDAWVFGAADPTSGMVALMEEARAVGELARAGHRPKRTIVYASWDAEEPGLLGSTEWVEDHADELRQKAAVYINTDGNGRGFLGVGGSHTLERFVNEIARDVVDPQTGVTVAERLNARRALSDADISLEGGTLDGHFKISPLGSGSDYSPFLQHLGVASLNIGYGGESGGGSYHSAYDTFEHYTRFGDPGFAYGIALAQTAGRATLRLANADVLPLRFTNFATTVSGYVDEVQKLAEEKRNETARTNALVAANAFELASDPTSEYVPPAAEEEVPFLNFAPILNVLGELTEAAKAYDRLMADGPPLASTPATAALDAVLISTERAMTDESGLPRRPWYRHQIYAPGYYTGYGVKTLPGIREGIEERKWDEAGAEIIDAAAAIERVTAAIESATEILEGSSR